MLIKKYVKYIYSVSSKPAILYALIGLLLALSYPIVNMHTDSDGSGWLPKDSKKLIIKNLYQEKFGSDEIVIVYLTFPDTVSETGHLKVLKQITDSITKNIHGFESVFSAYNIDRLKRVTGTKYAMQMKKKIFKY